MISEKGTLDGRESKQASLNLVARKAHRSDSRSVIRQAWRVVGMSGLRLRPTRPTELLGRGQRRHAGAVAAIARLRLLGIRRSRQKDAHQQGRQGKRPPRGSGNPHRRFSSPGFGNGKGGKKRRRGHCGGSGGADASRGCGVVTKARSLPGMLPHSTGVHYSSSRLISTIQGCRIVIPAHAGIQHLCHRKAFWTPAFAGVTRSVRTQILFNLELF